MKYRLLTLYAGFVLLCAIALKPGLYVPDGLGYFSHLPSLFLDGDLNFYNEFVIGGTISAHSSFAPGIRNGYVFNPWPIGSAIVWAPFWLIGHMLTILMDLLGQTWAKNGFTFYYNYGVHFATALMGLGSILVARKWSELRFSRSVIDWTSVLIVFGTPFYWYVFVYADEAHIPACFINTIFLVVWEWRRRGERHHYVLFLLGLLGGLSTIMRPHDGMILAFPLFLWIAELKKKTLSWSEARREFLWLTAGALIMMGLQFWIWQTLYGDFLGPAGRMTHYYVLFFHRFRLYENLFSSYHSLFFFAPVLLLSFVGLFTLLKKDRVLAFSCLFVLIGQILFLATERWFWAGLGFGFRRAVDWTPLFFIGLAAALDRWRGRIVRIAASVAMVWTLLLAWAYIHHPLYLMDEYQPPLQLLSWIGETIAALPGSFISLLPFQVPWSILLPALIVFAPIGYSVLTGILKVVPKNKNPLHTTTVLVAILLFLVATMYSLVGRGILRGDESKAKYAEGLRWYTAHSDALWNSIMAKRLINEGKFEALANGWPSAVPSFVEALRTSPAPEVTLAEIDGFVREHLSSRETEAYLAGLMQSTLQK